MAVYHNYIAVVGRIPHDDDDSCLLFEQLTEEQARIEFAKQMFEERFGDGAEQAQKDEIESIGGDLGVYITHVLASQSPIEQLYEHQG